ncbi:rodlin [Streptomyces sp. NPDC090442]|uniref:rodlin n=1 Tax=Streptomyces sp. NPDC090442 TaxID=3365962 RepID=UPI0037F91E4F
MIKKALATAAAAASIVGVAAAAAPQAMATGNHHHGTSTVNGNGSKQVYGNSTTYGYMSPQIGLIQGSLNKPCIALPVKGDVQSLVALVNVGVQDIPILSSPQNQQCTENSTQAKGDEALSHILDDIPIFSGNGKHNR